MGRACRAGRRVNFSGFGCERKRKDYQKVLDASWENNIKIYFRDIGSDGVDWI
jgi:hypothetical protein